MAQVRAPGHLIGEQIVRVLGGLRPYLAAEQGHVHALAAAGAGANVQGGENASDHVQRADVIGNERADRSWRIFFLAGGADEPAGGLAGEVRAFPVGVRPQRTEGAALGADDARIDRRQLVEAKPPLLQRAGLEVADHDVRVPCQRSEDLGAALVAQVQGDAAFAAIAAFVDGTARIVRRDVDVAAVIADAGQLDLDHVGAHVGQQRRRLGPLNVQARFEDANAAQGTGHGLPLARSPHAQASVHSRYTRAAVP